MKIARFTVNMYGENTYILWEEKNRQAIIIDPGMSNEAERKAVDDFISERKLKIERVLLTHQHIDHVMSVSYLASKYGCAVCAHEGDKQLGASLQGQATMLGVRGELHEYEVTEKIDDGQAIYLGGEKIEALSVPGHSKGGMSYYLPETGCVFVGDSLFAQSIGRTDLPGGDYEELIRSIKSKLLSLPEDTAVYSGHGPTTTIGDEKMYNPFLR